MKDNDDYPFFESMSKKKRPEAAAVKGSAKNKTKSLPVRLILIVSVLIIYGSSVNFEFTMDDDLFYQKHQSVQMGLSGFSEFFAHGSMFKFDGTTGVQPYRPASLLVFAIQKDLFDNSPAAAHMVNILIYLLVAFLLHALLSRLFPDIERTLVLLMTLFFVVHPVHTEVVASVKSLDELLAGAFAIAAWIMFVPRPGETKLAPLTLIAGSLLYFMALLSKENAISFLVIIPLCSWMLLGRSVKESLLQMIPLAFFTGLFLWMRNEAIGGQVTSAPMTILDNVIKNANGMAEVLATKSKILFYYLRLLFVPWPLSYDYSYNQVPVSGWLSPGALLGVVSYGFLSVLAILNFKKNPRLSFFILFFFIASAPTNNLFFLNGATVAERFLFTPSFLFGMAAVLLPARWLGIDVSAFSGSKKNMLTGIMVGWLLLFSVWSFVRAGVWKSNMTLFESGIVTAPNSSRSHYNLASECMTQARKAETPAESLALISRSLEEFDKSLEIYPENTEANYNKSICYTLMGDTARAMEQYKKTVKLNPKDKRPIFNLGQLFVGKRMYDSAGYCFEKAYEIEKNDPNIWEQLKVYYGNKGAGLFSRGSIDSAGLFFHKSLFFDPKNPTTLNNIANVHFAQKRYDSSRIYVQRALEINPGFLPALENMANLSYASKDYNAAIDYANRALRINGRSRKSLTILMDTYRAMGNNAEAEKYRQFFNSIP